VTELTERVIDHEARTETAASFGGPHNELLFANRQFLATNRFASAIAARDRSNNVCRLMAQNGHAAVTRRGPLLGIKLTWRLTSARPSAAIVARMSVSDMRDLSGYRSAHPSYETETVVARIRTSKASRSGTRQPN
jgi:hypothetical protein